MKLYMMSALALCLAMPATAQTPAGRWKWSEDTAALTGAKSITATITSKDMIGNMLGYPERAVLAIHCGEGRINVHVIWSQVLKEGTTNMFGQPKTLVFWRVDDEKIRGSFWDLTTTRTAAGEFKQSNAIKLLSRIAKGKELAVRMTGRETQDASFDLTGIDAVARRSPELAALS